MELTKFRQEKKSKDGWMFDYELLKQISKETENSDWYVSMEQVECVLEILCDGNIQILKDNLNDLIKDGGTIEDVKEYVNGL